MAQVADENNTRTLLLSTCHERLVLCSPSGQGGKPGPRLHAARRSENFLPPSTAEINPVRARDESVAAIRASAFLPCLKPCASPSPSTVCRKKSNERGINNRFRSSSRRELYDCRYRSFNQNTGENHASFLGNIHDNRFRCCSIVHAFMGDGFVASPSAGKRVSFGR